MSKSEFHQQCVSVYWLDRDSHACEGHLRSDTTVWLPSVDDDLVDL